MNYINEIKKALLEPSKNNIFDDKMTLKDFYVYLKHLKSLGCIIDDWSYSHTDKAWKVSFRMKPTSTPEWIQLHLEKI